MNDIYTDINEIPIFNYWKIFNTNDLSHLYLDKKLHAKEISDKKELERLNNAFTIIVYQNDEIKLSHEQILKFKLFIFQVKYELEQKSSLKNEILMLEKMIEKEHEKHIDNEWNLNNEIAAISKYLGFQIDKMKMSAADYISHRKNFLNYIENQKNK